MRGGDERGLGKRESRDPNGRESKLGEVAATSDQDLSSRDFSTSKILKGLNALMHTATSPAIAILHQKASVQKVFEKKYFI